MINFRENLLHITTFIFDFDGVLTDGKVTVINEHEQLRSAYVKDGYALQYAVKKGYRIAIISGGKSQSMSMRMESLGIKDVFLGVHDKVDIFKKYLTDNHLDASEVIYMGDDIPDYPVMKLVAVAACPADAVEEIRSISHYISDKKGGEGCVRDIIEQVLRLQGNWFKDTEAFIW